MRILLDYRPALRQRSGVGEYVHQLAGALADEGTHDITLFSSSWRHVVVRPPSGTAVVDRAVPVRLLNFLWHRLERPSVEWLTGGAFDVVHAPHPLLLPSQRAARVVTIHDLAFLEHPEWTRHEIRRDYPALVRAHAQRADAIVTVSRAVARQVVERLGVAEERVGVCPHGAPPWQARDHVPTHGYLLFVGTLEPRKNVGTLLEAYARLVERHPTVPELVLAGAPTPAAQPWLEALARPPLVGRTRHVGYVEDSGRTSLYRDALMLVLPSWDEGFGLPVVEAMAAGVPVIVSNRGALPEVVGNAGVVVDAADSAALSAAMAELLEHPAQLETLRQRGILRAQQFTWAASARAHCAVYEAAAERARRRLGEARGSRV
ncbi:MAG: glycosyltransferase [Luteitalea sp.]|nr:glycosyltransferase [Luteitalea sp.]